MNCTKTLHIFVTLGSELEGYNLSQDIGNYFNGFNIVMHGAKYSKTDEYKNYNKQFTTGNMRKLVSNAIGEDDGSRVLVLSGTAGGAARWNNRYAKHIRMLQPTNILNISQSQQEMINNAMVLPTKSMERHYIASYTRAFLQAESDKKPEDRWLTIKLMTYDTHPIKYRLLKRHLVQPFKSKPMVMFLHWYCR